MQKITFFTVLFLCFLSSVSGASKCYERGVCKGETYIIEIGGYGDDFDLDFQIGKLIRREEIKKFVIPGEKTKKEYRYFFKKIGKCETDCEYEAEDFYLKVKCVEDVCSGKKAIKKIGSFMEVYDVKHVFENGLIIGTKEGSDKIQKIEGDYIFGECNSIGKFKKGKSFFDDMGDEMSIDLIFSNGLIRSDDSYDKTGVSFSDYNISDLSSRLQCSDESPCGCSN